MVVSILIQVIDEANYHYIRPLGMNARNAWIALKAAHEDHTSGGRMYWLQKLIMTRMESGTDIVDHIRSMSQLYDRLNALVTAEKPLTADEIFATCLLISLPGDWLPPVSHLFQKPSISSSEVTITLEREAVRRSTREVKEPVVAAQATSSTRCSFCRRKGHDLNQCRTAAKVLKQSQSRGDGDPKVDDDQNRRSKPDQSRTGDHRSSSDRRNKAAVVVPLDSSDDESKHPTRTSLARVDFFDDQPSVSSVVCKTAEWLADTGCSHTMSPHHSDITDHRPRKVDIRLADRSVITSTHQGTARLPFLVTSNPPKALLVPTLEEPLLSISSVCDSGCEVLFTSTSMKIYPAGSISQSNKALAIGSRRNNLYYLGSEVRSPSTSTRLLKTHVFSLFEWHCRLGHIGLKPLRQLLRNLQVVVRECDEIEVQRCVTCVQSKMHRLPFKSRANFRAKNPGDLIH